MKKTILNIKTKAGALQYTIFISVVIALLVFAFISLTYVQQRLKTKATFFKEVVQNTNEGFSYLALNPVSNAKETGLLLTETTSKTTVTKKPWGLFEVAIVTSIKNNESFSKTALIGGHQNEKTGLYLQDQNQPLVVVGSTKIQGTSYLSKAGIKTGSIAGHSYVNKQLIYGDVKQSKNSLPRSSHIERLQQNLQEILEQKTNKTVSFSQEIKLTNSFEKPRLVIKNYGAIDLYNVQLTGNIIVQSETKITVQKNALIKEVLLIAPIIEIKEEVNGNFQAFASKKIIVGKNANLHYPTSLVLTNARRDAPINANAKEADLQIAKGATIKGIVAYLSTNKKDNYKAQILLSENAILTGELYCQENLELRGTVKGAVYTKGFIANQFGSVYKNHIYKGQILGNEVASQYTGLAFENSTQKVVKWLY